MCPQPDDPELLDQVDGNLEDADASASHVYAPDSKSQFSHVSFCRMSRVPRATLHLLALVHRKPAKSRGKGKNGKKKGETSPYKGGKSPYLGTPGDRRSSS